MLTIKLDLASLPASFMVELSALLQRYGLCSDAISFSGAVPQANFGSGFNYQQGGWFIPNNPIAGTSNPVFGGVPSHTTFVGGASNAKDTSKPGPSKTPAKGVKDKKALKETKKFRAEAASGSIPKETPKSSKEVPKSPSGKNASATQLKNHADASSSQVPLSGKEKRQAYIKPKEKKVPVVPKSSGDVWPKVYDYYPRSTGKPYGRKRLTGGETSKTPPTLNHQNPLASLHHLMHSYGVRGTNLGSKGLAPVWEYEDRWVVKVLPESKAERVITFDKSTDGTSVLSHNQARSMAIVAAFEAILDTAKLTGDVVPYWCVVTEDSTPSKDDPVNDVDESSGDTTTIPGAVDV